jgi:hypothetical protein
MSKIRGEAVERVRLVPKKPSTFAGNLADVPAELTGQPLWAVWRWTPREDDPASFSKPPFQARRPQSKASTRTPAHWTTFEAARNAVDARQADGVSFNLLGSELGALDLDHCRDRMGQIDDWAQNIVEQAERLGAYVEVTPSGAGLRVIGRATGDEVHRKFAIPGAADCAAVEIFRATAKAITVTGARLPHLEVAAMLPNIDKLIDDTVAIYDVRLPPPSKANGAAGNHEEPVDYEAVVRDGAPAGEDRSWWFNRCVWHFAGKGLDFEEIVERFEAHPSGVADRYIAQGRLDREVERCFAKWQAENPGATASSQAPAATPPRDRFKIIRVSQIELDPDPSWTIDELLPAGPSLGVVYGPPKQLKSFLLTHAFMHIAGGLDYAGRKVRKGAVVYITSEGVRGVKRRLVAMRRELGLDDPPFHLIAEVPDFGAGKGDCDILKARLERELGTQIAAIGIDTLRRAIPGKSESDQKDMGQFIDNCGRLAEHFKCNVSAVHHSPRADDSRTSGSNSLDAAADVMISCLRRGVGELQATATITHIKDGENEGESWDFEIVPVEVGRDCNENPLKSCYVRILTPLGQGVRRSPTARLPRRRLIVPKSCICLPIA